MSRRMFEMLMGCAVFGLLSVGPAVGQPTPGVRVTGAELEGWFAADEMAVAGVSTGSGCHWLTKGPLGARTQTVRCPQGAPITVTGVASIQGDRLCSKFTYPDGSQYEACQDIYRVGDNKFEIRVDGVVRNVMYRLVR
jgi:hypothetical protein